MRIKHEFVVLDTFKYWLNKRLKLYTWKNIEVIFIVSAGRTGTNYLSDFFNQVTDNTLSLHEPGPDLYELARAYVSGRIDHLTAVETLRRKRFSLCIHLNKGGYKRYIEANPQLVYLLPVVRDAFPEAKFVLIQRNSEDAVRSSYSKFNAANNEAHIFDQHESKERITAMDVKDKRYSDEWPTMTRFEKVCWNWYYSNELLKRWSDIDELSVRFSFESIFKDLSGNYSGIKELSSFIGVEGVQSYSHDELANLLSKSKNANDNYLLPKAFKEWPQEMQAFFTKVCARQMVELGYNNSQSA